MLRRGARRTIERGVYQDDSGYEVVARAGRLRQSQRYPADTKLAVMREWRDGTAEALRDEPQPTRDVRTLRGAITAYLEKTHLPKDHAYRPGLNAWQALHGDWERRKLTLAIAAQNARTLEA